MRIPERWIVIGLAVVMLSIGFLIARSLQAPAEPVATAPPDGDITGQPVPDFRLGSLNGSIFSPGNFSGQVTLYNFWATWCAPCVREMPMLQGLYEQFNDQGFVVVGIALDEVAAVRKFTSDLGINYPVLVGAGDVMRVNRAFGNISGALPYSVLVDRDGIVVWWSWGELEEAETRVRLESLL